MLVTLRWKGRKSRPLIVSSVEAQEYSLDPTPNAGLCPNPSGSSRVSWDMVDDHPPLASPVGMGVVDPEFRPQYNRTET